MSALPVYLNEGMLAVYTTPSAWGLFNPDPNNNTRFGTIDQVNSDSAFLATGGIVMYNERDVISPVFYNENTFYILPANKVIATEYIYYIEPPM